MKPRIRTLSHRQREFPFHIHKTDNAVSITEHAHDFIEFTYILAGSGSYTVGDVHGSFRPRMVIATPPSTPHSFTSGRGIQHRQISVAVYPDFTASLPLPVSPSNICAALSPMAYRIALSDGSAAVIRALFEDLFAEYTSALRHARYLVQLTVARLILLIDRAAADGTSVSPIPAGDDALVQNMLVFLARHLQDRSVLSDLAVHCRLPQRTVLRRFKRATGRTLREHLLTMRMDESKRLLTHSDLPIGHIAYESGFSDISLFDRLFKQHNGMSPREFRRRRNTP